MDELSVRSEKYLGMPSDVGASTNGAFNYLKDRVWKRVQGWMEQSLSAGGKGSLNQSSCSGDSHLLHDMFQTTTRIVRAHQWCVAEILVGAAKMARERRAGLPGTT